MAQRRVVPRSLAEIVASLGVVASLVFVGLEIRQNTIASRASAYQALGLTFVDGLLNIALDPDLALILTVAKDSSRWGELDEAEWARVDYRYRNIVRAYETIYLQVREGLLPDSALYEWGFRELNGSAVWRRLWPVVGPEDPEFRSFLAERLGIPP